MVIEELLCLTSDANDLTCVRRDWWVTLIDYGTSEHTHNQARGIDVGQEVTIEGRACEHLKD